MWFGGTTNPRTRTRPAGAQPVAGLPSIWLSPSYPEPHTAISYRTPGTGLVVIGTCAATTTEIRTATAHGVPDDVAWRWPGSYVVVEVTEPGVTLWTDLGATPLYTRRTPHGLLWASSSRLLASLHGEPELDLGALSARLAGDRSAGAVFTHVSPVPFGHRVRLSDRNIDQHPVWAPDDMVGDDHASRLRAALSAAVAARANPEHHLTTDFSGGFDSTALGLLAAQHLAPHRRRVTAVTLHPDGVHHGGDLDYARQASPHEGMRHLWMPMLPEHLPYNDLNLVPATDEPAPSTVAYAGFSAQLVWLAEHRSDVHMTGDGGDGLLLTPPSHIGYLLRHGHPWRALRETARWAQVRRISLWEALRTVRSAPAQETPFALGNPTHHAILTGRFEAARTARADVEIAHAFGVRLHNPYFDAHLIHTYVSTPVQDLPGPTEYKPILAAAMRDHFPPRLAHRTTKGDSSSDHHAGLRAALPSLTTLVDGHLAAAGLVNLDQVRATMGRVAVGVGDLSLVQPVIETETWVRAVHQAPHMGWETL